MAAAATNTETERELLTLVASGDVRAYARLFAAYRGRVYFHALSFLKSPQLAEEITTDIFVKVWDQRQKLTEIKSFPAWLFILGRNHLLTELRRKLVETTDVNQEQALYEDLLLPDQQYEYRETYRVIMEGVALLPPQQKAVFTLNRLEAQSHEAIAQQLGITKRTVRFHMVTALNFLRVYAREHGIHSINTLLLLLISRL